MTYSVTILAGKQSVLEELKALRLTVTDKQDAQKLDQAIDHLTKSLDPTLWNANGNQLDPKRGDMVFQEEKDTVVKLFDLLKYQKSTVDKAALQGFINRLVSADKALAKVAIDAAVVAGGDAKKIGKANQELSKGDALATSNYVDAIERYRNAWTHAIQAV